LKKRLLNILFWSVLSAAFIGPGTVTTAASAGADYGFQILWALVFSTIACVVLQEAAARLTTVSGHNLGQALQAYAPRTAFGQAGLYIVLFSIVLGCAAYEAGNILGASAGVDLIFGINPVWTVLFCGLIAVILLWKGSTHRVVQLLGFIVAFMGFSFLSTTVMMKPDFFEILKGSLIPRFPAHSELLILGLVGTTVVPYNLFLGSGLKHRQGLREMRVSLTLAIVLGGIISIAVMIVGTSVTQSFTFETLSQQLTLQLGPWASYMFGFGLFAAGLTSALTAPLAAAITAKSLLAQSERDNKWQSNGRYYRFTWSIVLLTGIGFGVSRIQPIPAIIMAQALNGIILPVIAIFLLLMVNNSSLLSRDTINSNRYNILMGLVVFITIILGLTNVFKALANLVTAIKVNERLIFGISVVLSILVIFPIYRSIINLRRASER